MRNRVLREIATQGHSRSFILHSVTGQQGVAYRHIILLALSLKFPKNYFTQIAKKCRRQQPQSHLRSLPRGTPTSTHTHLICPETRVIGPHTVAARMGLTSFKFVQWALKRIFSAPECVLAVQGRSGSSKVDDFGTNRKHVYDFLLVDHYEYNPILHRFWHTVTYWLKNSLFLLHFWCPSLTRRPHSLCSLWNFALKLTVRKLESWGYPPVQLLLLPVIQWINQSINPASKRL